MTVKATNEERVAQAIESLISGSPAVTDGSLTLSNLAREAGVSRSTVQRLPHLVEEFRKRAAGIKNESSLSALSDLSRRLQESSARESNLEQEIRVLALQVHSLSLENEALRGRLVQLDDNVRRIDRTDKPKGE